MGVAYTLVHFSRPVVNSVGDEIKEKGTEGGEKEREQSPRGAEREEVVMSMQREHVPNHLPCRKDGPFIQFPFLLGTPFACVKHIVLPLAAEQ